MDFFEIKAHGNHFKFTIVEVFDDSPFGGKDLRVEITVYSHGLSANISVYTTTWELIKFYDDLSASHRTLQGEVKYINYERDMELNLHYDYQGHIRVFGNLHVWPESNSLSFDFGTDQSYIDSTLADLRKIRSQFD